MVSPRGFRLIRRAYGSAAPSTPEEQATAYVSLRAALGFSTRSLESYARGLLAFMRARDIDCFSRLDRRTAAEWLRSGRPQELTVTGRLAAMRGLFKYLGGIGVVDDSIWDAFTYPRPKHFVPYVFSLAELRAIIEPLRDGGGSRRSQVVRARTAQYAMFHTTYACGLRASEICRLKIGDMDLERSLFVVRETKFGKTRLVPFNARTRQIVTEYLDRHRPKADDAGPDAPIFLSARNKPYLGRKFGQCFERACAGVGLYRPKVTKGNTVFGSTCLHGLRHSFAVHRLLKWYQEGADVNAKLPLLATYMGHARYHSTQKYLTVLPRFIDIARMLFARSFERSLRDVERPPDE
jgi:integrase/recombinase XerD